jgi:glycosyltransferase involved in cell wall biosynthesis
VIEPPIHVLFIVSSLCFGGAEKHLVTLCNRLDAASFRITLCYLKPVEALKEQLDLARLHSVACVNVRRKLDRTAVSAVAQLIDGNDIDVIVCINEYPALYAWLAARRARQAPKLIEIFHTTTYGRLKHQLQMLLYRRVLRRFDVLVYVSAKQQAYWHGRRLRAARDLVIHNGIDTDYFHDRYSAEEKQLLRARFGFEPADFVVGICAALRPEKAHGDLVQALARLRRAGVTRAKALIIGDGPERARIEGQIASLGLGGAVAVSGFQSDVRPFVACCDVMTLPSHAVETFSIAALEAMALGKPLVLSRIGGAEEQITDGVNGFLFEPGDIDALVRHLARLCDAPARERMSRAAAQRVRQDFDETQMIRQYAALLSGVRAASVSPPAGAICSI